MSETKENVFLNLLKKSVGLPTGEAKGSCCSTPAAGEAGKEKESK